MCLKLKEIVKRIFSSLDDKTTLRVDSAVANENDAKNKCHELIGMLTEGASISDVEAENVICNYIYLSQLINQDLAEINARLASLKVLEGTTPPDDTYLHKKIRYFYNLNQQAKDEVLTFLTDKLIPYILDAKEYKYSERKQDKLNMLFLDSRYNYAFLRRYYDMNYDFSTEAKIRFIPGVNLENMLDTIAQFVSLHRDDPEEYAKQIDKIVSKNKCIDFIADKVKGTYHLYHRAELFNTLVSLYNNGEYQSYIALAVIQLEGIFYDCCTILDRHEAKENFGTLIEKVDKVFSQNHIIKQAIYPHYAFSVPNLRNEIAHKGFSVEDNIYHQANELTLDLYTVVYWCSKLECDKFFSIYEAYRESIEEGIEEKYYDKQILTTLFSCYQTYDRGFLSVLAKPEEYGNELDFYKSLAPSVDLITIKERTHAISAIVKSESFWKVISNKLDSVTEHKPGKPYDFVDFIIQLRNVIIPVLGKDTPEKLACQEVSKKLKKYN